jgi:Flp pilus assembly protein TadG
MKKISDESGQALVELAVVMPCLISLFFGVVVFGKVIYSSIEVSNAAEAGVQYATQNSGTAADGTGIQNAAQAAAPDLTLTATATTSCTCSDGSAGPSSCTGFSCSTGFIQESVQVRTSATVIPLIKASGLPSSFTLKGQAIQECLE